MFDGARAKRILRRPLRKNIALLKLRFIVQWCRWFPQISLPIRLPYKCWWFTEADWVSMALFMGEFEEEERRFLGRFLKPNMVVLNGGAHHGLYAMLASRRVGPKGRVIAFEPSPRERTKLLWHIRLNRCHNVTVEPFALGAEEAEARLHVVLGHQKGLNSLRPPVIEATTQIVPVQVTTLDRYLEQHSIGHVDVVILDVEGAEKGVLQGASQLLSRKRRPIFMVEMEDMRTQPWGYQAKELYEFLQSKRYTWYAATPQGQILLAPMKRHYETNHNLIAVPQEKLEQVRPLIRQES